MLERDDDAALVRFPPPLVFAVATLAGVALQLSVPIALPLQDGARLALALGAWAAGLFLLGAAVGLFWRSGQKPEPWKTTPELLTRGIYRFTRNPMYLGFVLIQLGIGVWLENGWVVLLTAPAAAGVYVLAIRPEEHYLAGKFGDDYARYRERVRRWL